MTFYNPATKTELQTAINKWYTIANGNDNGGYSSSLEYANSFTKTQYDTNSHVYPYYGNPNTWDVKAVTSMFGLFFDIPTISNYSVHPEIGNWDVSEVIDMGNMFRNSSFNKNIGSWTTSNNTNMFGMFQDNNEFNQDISGWDVSNVINMAEMFRYATKFNQNINGWDVSQVTDMRSMFDHAAAFNQPIGNWDTTNVTSMDFMFYKAVKFNQNISTKLVNEGKSNEYIAWDTANVTSMVYMMKMINFEVSNGIPDYYLPNGVWNNGEELGQSGAPLNWNTSKVISLEQTFMGCRFFNQNISTKEVTIGPKTYISFDTRKANLYRIMSYTDAFNNGDVIGTSTKPLYWSLQSTNNMFYFWGAFTNVIVPGASYNQPMNTELVTIGTQNPITYTAWDTTNVTRMNYLFRSNAIFNQPLNSWNVSQVDTMNRMFQYATAFNQDISDWDVSKVNDMNSMFMDASSFNQDISGWDVSQVRNMYSMFYGAAAFNQDISGWDVSQVPNMYSMFRDASSFNQDISGWDVSWVTNMFSMFNGATSFNQDISDWDVSKVNDMNSMFMDASSFNQDIGSWNMNSITTINGMFENAISFDNAGSNTIDKWFYNRTTESIIDFQIAFKNANNFNRKITAWNVREDDIVTDMLTGTGIVEKNLYGFSSGTPSYTLFNQPICFNKGTKILCYVNNKEVYVPIEKLRKDMLVKTYNHGYKKIDIIKSGTYRLGRSSVGGYDVDQGMYKMVKEGEMIADLEMTGLHSILVDRNDAKYKNDIENSEFKEKSVKSSGSCYVDNKYRLKSKHCSKFIKMKRQDYTIYTFSLEHEREDMLYGIWANGVLVETTPRCHINKMTGAKDLVDEIIENKQ